MENLKLADFIKWLVYRGVTLPSDQGHPDFMTTVVKNFKEIGSDSQPNKPLCLSGHGSTLPNSTPDRTNLADILVLGEQICKIKSMGDVYNIATDGHLLAVDNNYTLDIYNMGW